MRVLLATQNQGKLEEFVATLPNSIEIVTPEHLGLAGLDVPENGSTLEENALLKAKAFAEKSGLTAIADDTAFEVVALDGKPGIHAKRWLPGTDQDRNQTLLEKLRTTDDRSARFRTVICLYDPETKHAEYFEGEVVGHLADQERGSQGFGYDPIFIPDGYSHTFAELGPEVKNTLSHRAKAIQLCAQYLQQ